MKRTKMFSFAAAALMAMAFAGATSATAGSTQLCASDPGSGACGNAVTHVHELNLTGNLIELETSVLGVKCEVLFLSTKVGALGAPQVILGSYTYTGCNNNCTVTEENGPAVLLLLKESHETAKVTLEWLVHLSCPPFIDCRFNGVGLLGTAKGPLLATEPNGEVKFVGQTLQKEGTSPLCPFTATLNLTTTPLSATYIGS